MTRWERLEEWMIDHHDTGSTFTYADVAEALDCSNKQATEIIQAYLTAQRSPRVNTLYVLHRTGRTSRAVWQVGESRRDMRSLSGQFFSDTRRMWTRAAEPDLARVAELNPRLARRCRRTIAMVADNAMAMLQLALEGELDTE